MRFIGNFSLIVILIVIILPTRAAAQDSDPEAIKIAEEVMESLGGEEAWEKTRFISWNFFGSRAQYWDKHTGDYRLESQDRLVLMNVHNKTGRVWENGEEITDPTALEEALSWGDQVWVNDSYWMFMPYKLRDPGVTLKYKGEDKLPDGRACKVLQMTFEDVGYTPENRYLVYVAKDTGLVEQWTFFQKATDEEPKFTMPWEGWKRFGEIMIATGHGRGEDWQIRVYEELPESVFKSPEPYVHD